jgi:hypothetical protein
VNLQLVTFLFCDLVWDQSSDNEELTQADDSCAEITRSAKSPANLKLYTIMTSNWNCPESASNCQFIHNWKRWLLFFRWRQSS